MNLLRESIVSLAIFISVSAASADPQSESAVSDPQRDKRSAISQQLVLDANQERSFWPLYDRHQIDLQKLGDKRLELIEDLQNKQNTLTDAEASDLIRRALGLEEQRLGLKRRYAALLLEKLPPRIVARYLQLENKIQSQVDAEISARVPLVNG